MWIVMEFCDLGDLNKFFEKYFLRLDMTNKVSLMRQIAKGIGGSKGGARDARPPPGGPNSFILMQFSAKM